MKIELEIKNQDGINYPVITINKHQISQDGVNGKFILEKYIQTENGKDIFNFHDSYYDLGIALENAKSL